MHRSVRCAELFYQFNTAGISSCEGQCGFLKRGKRILKEPLPVQYSERLQVKLSECRDVRMERQRGSKLLGEFGVWTWTPVRWDEKLKEHDIQGSLRGSLFLKKETDED